MPQDQESGAAAAAYGHRLGGALSRLLGARKLSEGANEVEWRQRRAVIKSCRLATTSFGITAAMLERLDVALVAIERADGGYEVFELPIDRFQVGMRDSRSGLADGRVKLLRRSDAEVHGCCIATFTAQQIYDAEPRLRIESSGLAMRHAALDAEPSLASGSGPSSISMPRTPATNVAVDGLDALRKEIGVAEIACLIERTARWVSPATFQLLPVWYPEHARGEKLFRAGWSEPQPNTTRATGASVHKQESNTYANTALSLALGLRKADRPNWSCCHIWGVDDARYQSANSVVKDRRFYSCVANMVLLPTPLKAFTDVMPEIKAMLRLCARNLYGWSCDHDELHHMNQKLDAWDAWDIYPPSWPRSPLAGLPLGVIATSAKIIAAAANRKNAIFRDLANAGHHYPNRAVSDALNYWNAVADRDGWQPPFPDRQ